MKDWQKRYDDALEEMTASRVEWDEAERAMARANFRRSRAERQVHRIFQEKMHQLTAGTAL